MGGGWCSHVFIRLWLCLDLLSSTCPSVSLSWLMPFCACIPGAPVQVFCAGADLRPSLGARPPPTQVLRAAPPTDRSGGAGAERTDAARPSGGAAERSVSLGSRMPSRGPRHLPPTLPARARALPQRRARGAPFAGGIGRGKKAVGRGELWGSRAPVRGATVMVVAVAVLVAQGGKRGRVMGRDRDGAKGEGAARSSGLRESSLLFSCTLPERAIHRCHQFPMSALLLACYHGAQAFPPAGAARGRPHQPHSAPAGQGRAADTSGDAWLVLNRGPCLDCSVPNWLQEGVVTRPLIISCGIALQLTELYYLSPNLLEKATGLGGEGGCPKLHSLLVVNPGPFNPRSTHSQAVPI